jgi:hypothetical protein
MTTRELSEEIVYRMEAMLNNCYALDTPSAWEELYYRVFSEKGSRTFHTLNPRFNYYDPDTTYREDATAFIRAARTHLIETPDIDIDGWFDTDSHFDR